MEHLSMEIMRTKYARSLCGIVIALSGMAYMWGQDLRTVHFKGSISDYTPSTVSGGPYQLGGRWSVDVQRTGEGAFSADLTMETSDYGISDSTAVDPANPGTRSPHTHHISLTNAVVSYDPSVCPSNSPPTTGSAVVLTGTATISANGGPAPFAANGPSGLQACVMGGTETNFSNLTLVFTGAATGHFGSQPIHGVVSDVSTQ